MKLPAKTPLVENAMVTSWDDLRNLIQEALSQGKGAFLKIFSKDSGKSYYITLLLDGSKVLAAEGLVVDTNERLDGARTLELLESLRDKPMIVDVYALNEVELKFAIAENLDTYSETPKTPLEKLFGGRSQSEPSVSSEGGTEKTYGGMGANEPEVLVELSGEGIREDAFRKYAEAIRRDSEKIRGVNVGRIEFKGTAKGGVVYLNVTVHGSSESRDRREVEILERRIFHVVSKNAPVILRVSGYRPILRDIKVLLDGREAKPLGIVDKDKKKTDYVDSAKKIRLTVLEDVWPYFSNFAKGVIEEIERAGMDVGSAYFDVKGRNEFEINLSIAVKGEYNRDTVERTIRGILSRNARELSKLIGRYVSVRTINAEVIQIPRTTKSYVETTSSKASEILAKKELLEREVEQLLQKAGIDELSFLTEEKKKEAERVLLKSRIEPAIEALKARIHAELKLIPRVTFKWLKLNHEVMGSKVYVDIEASFTKENVGGLFGAYSGVSDERIKGDISVAINRVIKEVSEEYNVPIILRKLNVSLR